MLSAILYLGNVTYKSKSTGRDEGLEVGPPDVLATLSDLLKVTCLFVSCATPFFTVSVCLFATVRIKLCGVPQVKEELLVEALTKRKTVTVNDKLILPYSHSEVGISHNDIFAPCHYYISIQLHINLWPSVSDSCLCLSASSLNHTYSRSFLPVTVKCSCSLYVYHAFPLFISKHYPVLRIFHLFW